MSLVYAYRAWEPVYGASELYAEHERRIVLWDEIVAIDHEVDAAILDAARADIPELGAVIQEADALTEAIRAAEDRAPLYAQRREKRVRKFELLKQWRKENADQYKAFEGNRTERVKRARQDSPCWWPNYNAVIANYRAARSSAMKFGRRLRPHDPNRDDLCMDVQIQRTRSGLGAAWEELLDGAVSVIQIGITPYERGKRWVDMRVDTDGNLVRFPVYLHRDPPGRIKAAQLVCDSHGEWKLCLTVDVPYRQPHTAYRRSGEMRLSWELFAGGITVATVAGRRYSLPAKWNRGMEHVSRLRAWLDHVRKQAIVDHPRHQTILEMPEREMLNVLLQRRLLSEWRRAWKRRWLEMNSLRRKLLRQRREMYRLWAREIVGEYPDLEIDDVRLDKVARTYRNAPENTLRQRACVHQLRAEIIHQANKAGSRVAASGKVLTWDGQETSSVWERARQRKTERSQNGVESTMNTGLSAQPGSSDA